eukprot:5875862-Pyramimonas_sp.AAC.1
MPTLHWERRPRRQLDRQAPTSRIVVGHGLTSFSGAPSFVCRVRSGGQRLIIRRGCLLERCSHFGAWIALLPLLAAFLMCQGPESIAISSC